MTTPLSTPTAARRRMLAERATLMALAIWTISTVYHFSISAASGTLNERYAAFIGVCAAVGLGLFALLFLVFEAARRMERLAALALCTGAVLVAMAAHTLFDSAMFGLFLGVNAMPQPANASRWAMLIAINLGPVAACYLIYAGGLGLIIAAAAIHEREARLAQALSAAQEAQLAALRFQINPHFLFNTLNAVVSLIGAGRNAEAETMVSRLSDFFRASLGTSPHAMVTLGDELDQMASYLEIEAARFGDRLRVDIDAPEELMQAEVPHLLLQPLLENAIKHGVACTKGPVTAAIRAARSGGTLLLIVEDDGAGAGTEAPERAGVGLANVAARLAALYGEAGELTTTALPRGFRAEVRLPLTLPPEAMLRAAE